MHESVIGLEVFQGNLTDGAAGEKQIINRQNKNVFVLSDSLFKPMGKVQAGIVKILVRDFFLSGKEWFVDG